jgi:hypothetical protein
MLTIMSAELLRDAQHAKAMEAQFPRVQKAKSAAGNFGKSRSAAYNGECRMESVSSACNRSNSHTLETTHDWRRETQPER